ncbi:hypothetical protein CWE15_03915 [Aliidiomarina taiwanensis]|uniref:DUF2066 domain-containing protein n=2 Tax=Aliidiomarina taiwanensis TaxID=946228 RepID=A0A432XAB7_9GAMM|nr:hypothetical protein CWE15_03915 [Aliidiomarina taiwanensis]
MLSALVVLLIAQASWQPAYGQSLVDENGMQQLLTARVEVNSQTRAERLRAAQLGFNEVLVRLAGHADVVSFEQVQSERRNASDYVIQYSYIREQGKTFLSATYNEERMLQLLRQVGSSVWSAQRPTVMLWLAEPSETGARGNTQLIARDSGHELLAGITEQASIRGLPVTFPLLDLTDLLAVSPSDVWGRFEGPVVAATERYAASGTAIARIQPTEQGYRAEWRLVVGGLHTTGSVAHADLHQLGVLFADALTEQVAAEYAVSFSNSEQTDVRLRLVNAGSLEKVIAAEALLESLGPVVKVAMARYHQGTVEFQLRVVGNKARVEQALELESRLQQIQDPWSRTQNDVLEYRWLH